MNTPIDNRFTMTLKKMDESRWAEISNLGTVINISISYMRIGDKGPAPPPSAAAIQHMIYEASIGQPVLDQVTVKAIILQVLKPDRILVLTELPLMISYGCGPKVQRHDFVLCDDGTMLFIGTDDITSQWEIYPPSWEEVVH